MDTVKDYVWYCGHEVCTRYLSRMKWVDTLMNSMWAWTVEYNYWFGTWGERGIFWEEHLILCRVWERKILGTNPCHLGRTLFPRLSPISPKATIEVPAFFINRAIRGSLCEGSIFSASTFHILTWA